MFYFQLYQYLFYMILTLQVFNCQNCTTEDMDTCIFPFEFQNKRYSACIPDKNKPGASWCSINVDGDSKCKGRIQCLNKDNCPQFKEFKRTQRSHPDYQKLVKKWKARICNRKERRLCCPITPENQEYPGNYLPKPGECGIKSSYEKLSISGGINANLGEFPWAVLLSYKVKKRWWDNNGTQKINETTEYKCGGTLINTRYVLTASHCHHGNYQVSSVILGEWKVGVDLDCKGSSLYKEQCIPKRQIVGVENVKTHEDYHMQAGGDLINDIALIRLRKHANLNKAVRPICLPLNKEQTSEDIGVENLVDAIVGRYTYVIGWGQTKPWQRINPEWGVAQNILQKVLIQIVSNEDCKSQLSKLYGGNVTIGPSHICGGGLDIRDSCKGDSGGGMFIKGFTTIYQIGIVSYGPPRCGTGYPGIYTRIGAFIPWIIQNMYD